MPAQQPSKRDSVVVAEWSESPFTSHERRSDLVEHRVVFERFADVGVDIRHEVRSTDETNAVPEEWTETDVYEVRPHGTTRVEADAGWWA